MDPKLVTLPAHNSKPPHTCVVTGRRDGEVVDFGKDYDGVDPHIYIRRERIEEAGEVCGMVRQKRVDELEQELTAAREGIDRLTAIVAGGEELSAAEDRLREALGPASTTEEK